MTISIEFISKIKQESQYDWVDISNGSVRVGKARCTLKKAAITICSINIYPEWEGKGYGKEFVDYCKRHFPVVIADRVRPSAIGFWETMGLHDNKDGNWIYKKV